MKLTKKRKEQIQNIVEELIGNEFEEMCKEICVPDYYKFQFLEYAISNNISVQCIGRTYAEMQKTYYKNFSQDPADLRQINQTITYLNLYSDDEKLNFVSELFNELKLAIFVAFEYIMLTIKGRFKGFRSHFVKVISKTIMDKVLKNLLNKSLTEYEQLKDFSEEELSYANSIIKKLFTANTQKNPSKDCLGYRFIIDAVDYSTNEKDLKDFVYVLFNFCKDFFFEHGYDIIEIKDYIKNPKKKNNYQSLHSTVDIMGLPIELQFRTNAMDYEAEEGTASHDKIYKDTVLQNFVKKLMYDASEKLKRVAMNERSGLLVSQTIPLNFVCRTPHAEIPATPALLKPFENLDLLREIYEKSPKI